MISIFFKREKKTFTSLETFIKIILYELYFFLDIVYIDFLWLNIHAIDNIRMIIIFIQKQTEKKHPLSKKKKKKN